VGLRNFGKRIGAEYTGFFRGDWIKSISCITHFKPHLPTGLAGAIYIFLDGGRDSQKRTCSAEICKGPVENALVVGCVGSFIGLSLQALLMGNLLTHPFAAYGGFILSIALYLVSIRSREVSSQGEQGPGRLRLEQGSEERPLLGGENFGDGAGFL